jgi:hypothetical protein
MEGTGRKSPFSPDELQIRKPDIRSIMKLITIEIRRSQNEDGSCFQVENV